MDQVLSRVSARKNHATAFANAAARTTPRSDGAAGSPLLALAHAPQPQPQPQPAITHNRDAVASTTTALALRRIREASETFPAHGTHDGASIDAWMQKLCHVHSVTDTAAVASALHLLDKAATTAREDAVVSTARKWLSFKQQARALLSNSFIEGTCSGAGAAADADVTGEGVDFVDPDNMRKARKTAPEGVALEYFLCRAKSKTWVMHRGCVFHDVCGVATHVNTIRAAVLDVCLETDADVHAYLLEHSVALDGIVQALSSGAYARFPMVTLDVAAVAFKDCMVRMTAAGICIEPSRRLVDETKADGGISTPRAYVDAAFGSACAASVDSVTALFPSTGRACVLRTLGAMLQPRTVRHGDRWSFVIIATGPQDSTTLHPVEWLLKTFIGMGVVHTLHGVNVADRTAARPMCLLLTASSSGMLTPDQQSQIVLASVSDICTVVRSPYVPPCMCVNEGLRLTGVVVDVRVMPSLSMYAAAAPHVLPVLVGAYAATPIEKRQLVCPIFDQDSLPCRVEAPVAQSACTLIGEMLQAGFGVRMVPHMQAEFTRVRVAFNAYQAIRGYDGFAATTLAAEDVLDAAALICTHFPCLKPSGDAAVRWARSTETFLNLAIL